MANPATTSAHVGSVAYAQHRNSAHCTFGTSMPFDGISEPGCYVCNWSGHLLRVPQESLISGRSPFATIVGYEPLFVTKISDNPYIPTAKAKMLACNLDLNVNF